MKEQEENAGAVLLQLAGLPVVAALLSYYHRSILLPGFASTLECIVVVLPT